MEKSIARQISEYSVSLEYKHLPEEVIHEVKRYMYDSIGCAFGGYHTKDVNIILFCLKLIRYSLFDLRKLYEVNSSILI